MLERISVPRRALDFEDYMDILRRNFRWILGACFRRSGDLYRHRLFHAGYLRFPGAHPYRSATDTG